MNSSTLLRRSPSLLRVTASSGRAFFQRKLDISETGTGPGRQSLSAPYRRALSCMRRTATPGLGENLRRAMRNVIASSSRAASMRTAGLRLSSSLAAARPTRTARRARNRRRVAGSYPNAPFLTTTTPTRLIPSLSMNVTARKRSVDNARMPVRLSFDRSFFASQPTLDAPGVMLHNEALRESCRGALYRARLVSARPRRVLVQSACSLAANVESVARMPGHPSLSWSSLSADGAVAERASRALRSRRGAFAPRTALRAHIYILMSIALAMRGFLRYLRQLNTEPAERDSARQPGHLAVDRSWVRDQSDTGLPAFPAHAMRLAVSRIRTSRARIHCLACQAIYDTLLRVA